MITELTKEQEAKVPEYVDRYIEAGLSCEPVDPDKVRAAVEAVYDIMGTPKPGVPIDICGGPVEAWYRLCDVAGITGDDRKRYIFPGLRGNLDADVIGTADFCYSELDLPKSEDIEKYKLIMDLGLTYILPDRAICSDRPLYIKLEGEVLHCVDGPAIEFRDGTKIWAIEGNSVDEQIVMRPTTQTIDQIHKESNEDVRAIRIERFGWLPYLQQTGASCLDERANEIEGTYEALFTTERYGNRLVATCTTGRIMVMGVPREIKSCDEAAIWLGGSGGRKVRVIGRT